MVRLMEGPLGVLVQVRPLQTKGCDAYVDREECSAATSQQVEEVRKAKSVRVMNTSLIYIYILRMQSSVQAQGVELGKEVPMQVSKGTQLRLMEGPRRVLVLRPLQTFGNIIRRLPYRGSRTGRRRRGTSPLKVSPSHCGEIREGGGHNLTLFCNIYCSGTVHDKMLPSHTLFLQEWLSRTKEGDTPCPRYCGRR